MDNKKCINCKHCLVYNDVTDGLYATCLKGNWLTTYKPFMINDVFEDTCESFENKKKES